MMFKQKLFISTAIALSFLSFHAFAQTSKKLKTIIVDAGHGGKDVGAHGGYDGGLDSYEKNVTLAISNKLVAELKKQLPDVRVIPTRTSDIYQSPPEKADIANENKGDLFICIHADAANLKTGTRVVGHKTITVYDTHVEWIKVGKKKVKKITKTPRDIEKPIVEHYKMPTERSGTSIWIFAAHKTSIKLQAIMNNEDIEIEAGSDTLNNIDFSSTENKILATIYAKRYQEKSIKLANLVDEQIGLTGRNALGINQRQKGIWVLQATNMPAILVETGFITNPDDEKYLNSDKGQQELADAITKAVKKYKAQLEKPKSQKP